MCRSVRQMAKTMIGWKCLKSQLMMLNVGRGKRRRRTLILDLQVCGWLTWWRLWNCRLFPSIDNSFYRWVNKIEVANSAGFDHLTCEWVRRVHRYQTHWMRMRSHICRDTWSLSLCSRMNLLVVTLCVCSDTQTDSGLKTLFLSPVPQTRMETARNDAL